MKFKKIILSILITFAIVGINSKSYAKFVFEYTQKAAQITIMN